MVTVVLSSSAGHTGVAGAFGVGGLLVPRVGFFGLLAVLVRSAGPANSFSVWVFLGHRYRSCWYPLVSRVLFDIALSPLFGEVSSGSQHLSANDFGGGRTAFWSSAISIVL